jgi:UDP-GlcNAc:undecaprenyl-phosphate/decaprenyl-phosphate GlcNAc-1-phosphate transferase
MYSLLFLALLSLTLSLVLTPLVSYLCTYCGILDHPNGRKLHGNPIPRAGGVAIVLSYLIACSIFLTTNAKGGSIIWASHDNILQLIPAAVLVFVAGLVDDIYGIKAITKLLAETAAAVCAYLAGVHLTTVGGHMLSPWLSMPATVIWLVLCANSLNLIDGLDGLACGIGLFATATALLAAGVQHNVPLALAVIPLFGALLGFLRYNYNPARIFLGDSGSLFVGFLLGCFGILWTQKSATLLGMTAPLMVFAIPLLDTSLAIARRFLHNKPIFSADRGHIHHRLLARGLAPRKVVLVLYACCAVGALCSIAVVNSHTSEGALIVFGVLIWVGVNRLHYAEFGIVARFLQPRNFSPIIAAQMRLTTLQHDLAAATTTDACWLAVRSASAELGFNQLCMKIDGQFYEERFARESRQQKTCTIRIPLSSTEFINIGHDFTCSTAPVIMAPLAAILYSGLQRNAGVLSSDTQELEAPSVVALESVS